MKRDKKTITLGSGSLFIREFTGSVPSGAVELKKFYEELETLENELGKISSGAKLDYAPEFYTATDDLGTVKKTILQSEEVTLSSGILTWNAKTLEKLCATGRVEEDSAQGLRIIKIGGLNNQVNKDYIVHFLHRDAKDGDVRITIVGKNTSGFNLEFAKDKETVTDAEFKAVPADDEGTLIIYSETIDTIEKLEVTSVAGTTTGKTKITVKPAKISGNTYKYKTGSQVEIPLYLAECGSTYTDWDGTADISATTDNQIVIVEVDSTNKALKSGITKVVSKA